MAYYDALKAIWPTLTGTTYEKLLQLESIMVAGQPKPVGIAQVMSYLRTRNLWLEIKAAAETNAAAAVVVDLSSDLRASEIDFSLPITQQMLNLLKQDGLLSEENIDDLINLSKVNVSWREANGYPAPINMNDLVSAGDLE